MRKPKQPKTKDPVKLAQMRERMAKARAAREAKKFAEKMDHLARIGSGLPQGESLEEAAEENGGPILPPPVESDPSPAAPPGDVMTSFTGTPPATEWPSYMPVAHGEREFQVIQMPQNPRLVICRDPSQPDQRFHVDVGNNENFAIGMTLKAIPKPAPENAFWKLMGPLPRYKGRY